MPIKITLVSPWIQLILILLAVDSRSKPLHNAHKVIQNHGTCTYDDTTEPLSEEALELLGEFLFDRVPEYDYDESIDSGYVLEMLPVYVQHKIRIPSDIAALTGNYV